MVKDVSQDRYELYVPDPDESLLSGESIRQVACMFPMADKDGSICELKTNRWHF